MQTWVLSGAYKGGIIIIGHSKYILQQPPLLSVLSGLILIRLVWKKELPLTWLALKSHDLYFKVFKKPVLTEL